MTESPSETPGRFLVLEGPDGGGKTTQAARLAGWLRSIVLERSSVAIGMRAEMLLYMASRAQLVEEVIRPALGRGEVVVCDRFLLSNIVYQGYAGGLDVDDLWRVGLTATGGLLPDLTLVIDVPPEVAKARIGPSRDRIEDRGDAYRARVRDGFLLASRSYPAPVVVVDGSADPDDVASRLQSEVSRALALPPWP